MDQTKFLSFRN